MNVSPSESPRRYAVPLAIVILIVMGIGIALWHGHGGGTAAQPTATPVNGIRVEKRDVSIYVDAVGTVTSLNVAPIRAQVDGQLTRVEFREGQDVQKGAVLAVIDVRPYQAAVAQAEAAVRRDEALASDLQLTESRAAKLAQLGAGPHQSADTLKAQLSAAQATVAADRASADAARLNLQFATIRAPIDGRVGLRQVDLGSIVHASDTTPLVTVTQVRPISVLFSVPQSALADIQEQQRHAPLEVLVRENPRHDYVRGELAAIDSTIDPTTGQIKLRANFPNDDRSLWPGELVSVRVRVRTLPNALVLPDAAVVNGQAGPFVFKVGTDSKVHVQSIGVETDVDGLRVIRTGLALGDQVVLRGQSRLADGSTVQVQAESAPTASGSAASGSAASAAP